MNAHGFKVTAKRWEQEVPVMLRVDATTRDGTDQGGLRKPCVLPFLPRAMDELAVGWQGDYVTVEAVYWCPEEGLTIWIMDRDGVGRLEQLLQDGWVYDIEVPMPAPASTSFATRPKTSIAKP